MKYARNISLLAAVAFSLLMLAACGQKANCSGITFGGGSGSSGAGSLGGTTSSCGPSSGGTGGGGGGGTGTASDLLYYLGGGTVIDVASLSGASFGNVIGYTPIGFPNGTILGLNFAIVNQKYLYVPSSAPSGGGGQILAYAITRATGALTPLTSSPFPTTTTAADIAVGDPQGRFLFVSDLADASVTTLKVDAATGNLSVTGTLQGEAPMQMVVDGTGNYLYFPIGDFVFGFSIDQVSGTLTALAGSPFPITAPALQADPTGRFLLGTGTGDTTVSVIPITPGTGFLGIPTTFPTVSAPSSLALSPNGKFLFTFAVDRSRQPLPLEGYSFDVTTGTLTAMANSPFTSLPRVALGIFDQNGSALMGVTTTNFTPYFIDATTGAPTSPVTALSVPHDERYAITN